MTGKRPRTLVAGLLFSLAGVPAAAQDGPGLFEGRTASVTYGFYVRGELGRAEPSLGDGYWLPPGEFDPRVSLDFSADRVNLGAAGIGYDWMNGFRADVTFLATGHGSVEGACSCTSDGTPCADHVESIETTLNTEALMASLFYAPLEQRGSNSIFQPFLVAGVGFARNSVDTWTRVNSDAMRPVRSFEGGQSEGLAWSVGFGAALQVTRPGGWPLIVEAAFRHYDFGNVEGGDVPLPDNGLTRPRQPISFDVTSQVLSVGVRIPLTRY